jgi:NAD(P)-dependent dehydrogenase (short-subunit alcohol dehydrogenase family)
MKRLEGRVALVTGAASGIGHATAFRLTQEGAAVVVTDIQDEAGEFAAKSIQEGGGRSVCPP